MENPFSYQGKRVVITGAYSGVGAATVELLSSLGASEIIALDIKRPEGPISRFIETHMGDAAAVDAAAERIEGPIDVLFNNAGIAATHALPDVLAVNWLGLRQLSEALLPLLVSPGVTIGDAMVEAKQEVALQHPEAVDVLLGWTLLGDPGMKVEGP